MKVMILLALFFTSHAALATTECEVVEALKIVKQIQCEKSEGNVYHENGKFAGIRGVKWYHSTGARGGDPVNNMYYHANDAYAGSIGGNWYHPNGERAFAKDKWYWSNGKYAGTNGGRWYGPTGKYIGTFSNMTEMEQLKFVLD
ncbi:hypothetical protein [Bdellovibrio sp. HCB274]|uniref:hypothetical protein n=1 Tax=Bdellovibrio sp. HCB274 TaxID=3394361 RepID=UPI0039B64C68